MTVQKKIAAQACKIIQKKGVILRALPGDIIGFCPPLIISNNQIDEMFDIIEASMPEIDKIAKALI